MEYKRDTKQTHCSVNSHDLLKKKVNTDQRVREDDSIANTNVDSNKEGIRSIQ